MDNRPIGVFDSGLGGLTGVRELRKRLPHEDIIYFGDTGRVPYGSRSPETILQYARQDVAFLLSKNVKCIMAACGTVSSIYPAAEAAKLPVPYLGVVDAAAREAAFVTRNRRIGVIGTAPSGPDVIDGFVGSHGGNMDNKKITKGTRLYFPVRVPGALLQMGDVHATMGDAELCGTGIEIPAEITVRVQLVKDFELNWPVLETFGPDGKWYVNCSGTHYEQALMNGSKELQRLLMRVTGWDAVETYMYMSVQSDVEVSQGCEPCEVDVSLRIGTPKLSEFPVLIPQP